MKTNNYTGLVFSIGVIALAIGIFYNVATHKVIKVDNEYWYTTVADTRESMALGLGDRDSIFSTCGMLFDFKDGLDKERIFWMKDMKFNLDIYMPRIITQNKSFAQFKIRIAADFKVFL